MLGAMHPGGPVVRIHLRGVSRESIAFLSVTEVAHIHIYIYIYIYIHTLAEILAHTARLVASR